MQVRVLLVLARNTRKKPERYLHLLLPLEPRCSFWIYRKLQSMHHKCRPMCSNHRFYFDISAFHSVKKFRFFIPTRTVTIPVYTRSFRDKVDRISNSVKRAWNSNSDHTQHWSSDWLNKTFETKSRQSQILTSINRIHCLYIFKKLLLFFRTCTHWMEYFMRVPIHSKPALSPVCAASLATRSISTFFPGDDVTVHPLFTFKDYTTSFRTVW